MTHNIYKSLHRRLKIGGDFGCSGWVCSFCSTWPPSWYCYYKLDGVLTLNKDCDLVFWVIFICKCIWYVIGMYKWAIWDEL